MSQPLRPRVLLADNHAGILGALQRMLSPSCDMVACVTDGAALLEATTRLSPDVVVLDISMPGLNGLDACREIKRATPHIKVVILTAANDADTKQKAFSVGASAFVLKHRMADDLFGAIQKAMGEDSSSSPS